MYLNLADVKIISRRLIIPLVRVRVVLDYYDHFHTPNRGCAITPLYPCIVNSSPPTRAKSLQLGLISPCIGTALCKCALIHADENK